MALEFLFDNFEKNCYTIFKEGDKVKYCIDGRQPYSIMKKSDQIKVRYEDRDRIIDFVERIPDKEIILELKEVPEVSDFATWRMYDEKFENFYIASFNLALFDILNAEGIKWYWPYPITSYYELREVLTLKPAYVQIGPPLSFDLENVKKIAGDVKLRLVCNCARPSYLPDEQGLPQFFGQFVRPEDVPLYDPYVDAFDFDSKDMKKEETLLHIYKDNQMWPGNLNLLIDNLNYNVDNRAIPEEFGKARVDCRQRCQSGGACRLCQRTFEFADALRKEKIRRRQEAEVDNN